jgi:cephalosporin hydroxylase
MTKAQYRTLTRKFRKPFNRYFAFRQLRKFHERPRSLEEIVQWALNFNSSGFYRVMTSQMPSEILSLTRAVAELKPEIILEIGTARGGTLLIWSQLASREVMTCDLQDLSDKADLLKAFPPKGSQCAVTLLQGNSHDAGFKQQVARHLNGRKVDFLFIDGDHTETGVTADYMEYREFVRPGGIIAFHDIVESQPFATNQVYNLWERLRLELQTEEFIQDPGQSGFGIGMIRVPFGQKG